MQPFASLAVPERNWSSAPGSAAGNVSVTASATPHTKGAWATVHAAVAYDVFGFTCALMNNNAGATQTNNLIDIGIGAAGQEQVIVPDIVSTCPTAVSIGQPAPYFPIFIPKGTRIAARIQSNVASRTSNVMIMTHGGASQPMQAYAGCVAIGVNQAASAGLAHTAGNSAGPDSAWTNIGSATSRALKALMLLAQMDTDTTMSALSYFFRYGYSSTILGETIVGTTTVEAICTICPPQPRPVFIPSGTQLQVSGRCSGTAEPLQLALYGFF